MTSLHRKLQKQNSRAKPENKAREKTQIKAWRRANPLKWAAIQKNQDLKREYGITLEEFQQMFANQEGLCAICSQPMCMCIGQRCTTQAVVDHNHETGKLRSLLHNSCNRGIGFFKESPTFLRNAAGYLEAQ